MKKTFWYIAYIIFILVVLFKVGKDVGICEMGTSGNCGLGGAYMLIVTYIILIFFNLVILSILNVIKKGQFFYQFIKTILFLGIFIIAGFQIGRYYSFYFLNTI